MAGPKSKNSRNVTAANNKKPQLAAGMSLLIPCGGGATAYVYDADTGKNPNLRTDTDAFTDAIRANVAAGYGVKVREELEALAARSEKWAATLGRLDAAEVFTPAA